MTWQFVDTRHPGFRRSLIVALALAVAGTGMAAAQQTVYVGGSGKKPVEVHMEALDRLISPYRSRVVLDPPGQAPQSAFLLGSPPAATAAPLTKPLVAPTATPIAAPEPKPAVAAAMPAPASEAAPAMPEPTVTLPTLTAAAEPSLPELVPATEPAPLTPVAVEPLSEPPAEPMPSTPETVALAPPEPLPATEPEPVAVPEPEPTVAALTPGPAPASGEILSIPFSGGSSELPGSGEANLAAIAAQLAANDNLRAQVKAYADGSSGSASSARRLSLSRALAVRSILIELGVRSTRIDVRALGDRNEGGAPDRVDVLVINR